MLLPLNSLQHLNTPSCWFFFYDYCFQKSSKKKEKEKQTCRGCHESFNFTKRKHHCKSCGVVGAEEAILLWGIKKRNDGKERVGTSGKYNLDSQCAVFSPLCLSAAHLCKMFKDLGQQNEPSVSRMFRSQPQRWNDVWRWTEEKSCTWGKMALKAGVLIMTEVHNCNKRGKTHMISKEKIIIKNKPEECGMCLCYTSFIWRCNIKL